VQQTEQPSLSDWSILIFKVLCLITPPAMPFMLGLAACKQQEHLCHPPMPLPAITLVLTLIMMIIFNFGLVGIHLKSHIGHWNELLLIGPSIFVSFFSNSVSNLVLLIWLHDYIVSCPDGEEQEMITAEESDAALKRFESLKSATNPLLFLAFPFLQLLLVFSLYNTLIGEK